MVGMPITVFKLELVGVSICPRNKAIKGEKPDHSFKFETQISIYFGRDTFKNIFEDKE